MVIEGVSGVGALISILKPASVAALTVELPKNSDSRFVLFKIREIFK